MLVNPWVSRDGDPGEQGALCAAALTWFVALAILRRSGLPPQRTAAVRKGITLLAALGTAADVMPVNSPFNRSLLRTGLRLMDDPDNGGPGFRGLLDLAGIKGAPAIDDFGWRIGPRLNAGSRMGESELASSCLRETNRESALDLAQQLDGLNRKRIQLVNSARREILASADRDQLAQGPLNVNLTDSATPGIVGLLASRLVKEFGWPALSLARRKDGNLAGSGRSSLGFDLGLAVSQAREDGLLISGGGHAAACGVVLRPGNLDPFKRFMQARFRERSVGPLDPSRPTHVIQSRLSGTWLSAGRLLETAAAQDRMAPWGAGLPAPLYGVQECKLTGGRLVKDQHLFLDLASGGQRFEAVWWSPPSDWPERLALDSAAQIYGGGWTRPGSFEIAGTVEANEWMGRRTGRLVVRDARALRH